MTPSLLFTVLSRYRRRQIKIGLVAPIARQPYCSLLNAYYFVGFLQSSFLWASCKVAFLWTSSSGVPRKIKFCLSVCLSVCLSLVRMAILQVCKLEPRAESGRVSLYTSHESGHNALIMVFITFGVLPLTPNRLVRAQ